MKLSNTFHQDDFGPIQYHIKYIPKIEVRLCLSDVSTNGENCSAIITAHSMVQSLISSYEVTPSVLDDSEATPSSEESADARVSESSAGSTGTRSSFDSEQFKSNKYSMCIKMLNWNQPANENNSIVLFLVQKLLKLCQLKL